MKSILVIFFFSLLFQMCLLSTSHHSLCFGSIDVRIAYRLLFVIAGIRWYVISDFWLQSECSKPFIEGRLGGQALRSMVIIVRCRWLEEFLVPLADVDRWTHIPLKNALSGIGNCLLCALYLSQRSIAIPSRATPNNNIAHSSFNGDLCRHKFRRLTVWFMGPPSYALLNLNNDWDWYCKIACGHLESEV